MQFQIFSYPEREVKEPHAATEPQAVYSWTSL